MASLKFESSLTRLEELVRTLEQGDLSLEESLKVFEEGIRLSKNCTKLLNEAEKKVEMLINDKEQEAVPKALGAIPPTDFNKTEIERGTSPAKAPCPAGGTYPETVPE